VRRSAVREKAHDAPMMAKRPERKPKQRWRRKFSI
jgi:hypothetical protein